MHTYLADLHVEPHLGSSLSTQELMTRLCFLLGEATGSTASSPMEDRREKKGDTSAQGGSPSSTLTCSTTSPCTESPTSTLSTSAGGQSLPQPLPLSSPHRCSSISPCGTLSSPAHSPTPCPTSGLISVSSPGPPTQSPTSTLESKDSGIIATITSSSENEERSTSSDVLTKEEAPGGSGGVMGRAGDDRHPGQTRDNLTAPQPDALSRSEIMESRTPPAPKRPLPQHHIQGLSSLAMPRPNSVAGTA
ncbi:protein TANC1-like [Poecilia reticulata]|uniref:protein TANC1-like n=1 Tax=Poecilia reticulata TaxID=8081 RepID=UPI0007EA23C5|nr:PREDICTED: protein TANC1-like [Poecilia reticulata]